MNLAFIVVIIALLGLGYATGAEALSSVMPLPDGGDVSPQNTGNDTGLNMYKTDSSLTGAEITNDPQSWPGSDKIYDICAAVAMAEGYNLGRGTAPYDLNNPGDLSPGDEAGQATGGGAQVHDGSAIICFATAEGGWQALHTKFSNIVTGRSRIYPVTWTWAQVAVKYAGKSDAWLRNVTNYLGVDPQSTPAQYVNS